jgi:uncharacterized protein (UPF0332 family)
VLARRVVESLVFLDSPYQQESALLEFSATMAAMHDYLAKAHENLAGAESELQHGRTNSCARSAYYACFHAAIAALLHAGLTSPEPSRGWGHDWVHASFVGQLIQRRKLYPSNLRRSLPDLLALRHKGDYRATRVSQREAQQAVRSAQTLVRAVTAHLQGEKGYT